MWPFGNRFAHRARSRLEMTTVELESQRLKNEYFRVCQSLRDQSHRNFSYQMDPLLFKVYGHDFQHLVEEHIKQHRQAIEYVCGYSGWLPPGDDSKTKSGILKSLYKIRGRTGLLLQGGGMMAMMHLGVVKALYDRHLLPTIIIGTSTGSLIGALICTRQDADFPPLFRGENISLEAFRDYHPPAKDRYSSDQSLLGRTTLWFEPIRRKLHRFRRTGNFFNVDLLRVVIRDNLGDITFAEAYQLTGRELNVTVPLTDDRHIPQLLNRFSAKRVCIWSAVVASIATSKQVYGATKLYEKNADGNLEEFMPWDDSVHDRGRARYRPPMLSLGRMHNCNHLIISQTRAYKIPFMKIRAWVGRYWVLRSLCLIVFFPIIFTLILLSLLGCIPGYIEQTFQDDVFYSSLGHHGKLYIWPQIGLRDLFRVLERPTRQNIARWARRGEASTSPKIREIRNKCELERFVEPLYRANPPDVWERDQRFH